MSVSYFVLRVENSLYHMQFKFKTFFFFYIKYYFIMKSLCVCKREIMGCSVLAESILSNYN